MASQGYLSDSQAMTRAVTGFAECAANAKKTMSDLESELTATLASYAGDQATAFWQLHLQLQDKMKQASNELDTMSSLVNNSFQNYGSGDSHGRVQLEVPGRHGRRRRCRPRPPDRRLIRERTEGHDCRPDQRQLRRAAVQLAGVGGQGQGAHRLPDQLSSNLQPLKQSWYASNSSAGTACEQAETRLRSAANDIVNIINQFGGKVSDAHDLQYALEQKNTSYFA